PYTLHQRGKALPLAFSLGQFGFSGRKGLVLGLPLAEGGTVLGLAAFQLFLLALQQAFIVLDLLLGAFQLALGIGDLLLKQGFVFCVLGDAFIQFRLRRIAGAFGFVVNVVVAGLLLLFGQLLQYWSFFIHHILVFVLIKGKALGVFVGEEHIGIDL